MTDQPAFPQSCVWNAARAEYESTEQSPGLTKREWYAGMALAGLMANPTHGDDGAVKYALWLADAMIEASKDTDRG